MKLHSLSPACGGGSGWGCKNRRILILRTLTPALRRDAGQGDPAAGSDLA
jgi:hypothetical protein